MRQSGQRHKTTPCARTKGAILQSCQGVIAACSRGCVIPFFSYASLVSAVAALLWQPGADDDKAKGAVCQAMVVYHVWQTL